MVNYIAHDESACSCSLFGTTNKFAFTHPYANAGVMTNIKEPWDVNR